MLAFAVLAGPAPAETLGEKIGVNSTLRRFGDRDLLPVKTAAAARSAISVLP